MPSPLNCQLSKNRIGFALSTKERTDFTEKILPGLDCGGFDLIWCDGSTMPEGKAFASPRHFKKTPLTEVHFDVGGGPDAAIRFSLKRLLAKGYDYVGLIENDIQLKPAWLEAMMCAWEAAQKDGFNVGAVTARTAASRVLARAESYTVQWNLGAGMSLFSRAGAEAVLADYPSTNAKTIHEFYLNRYGINLADAWELFMEKPDRGLGCDWYFAAAMLKKGLVSLGVVPNHAENIDVDFETVCGTQFVRSDSQPLPAHCITPEKLLAAIKHHYLSPTVPISKGRAKVTEVVSKGKDLTGVQNNSWFEHFLRDIIRDTRPNFIVETGTYLGQGTTRIISSALKENHLDGAHFYSIECNPEHHTQAQANLANSGLLPFVKLLHGVSVPRSLLPDAEAIRKEVIENAHGDIFVDHDEEKRVELYLNETNYPNLPEDLLGVCLRECGGKPDLLLLDSAGHMGNVEFNYVLTLLRGPCYIALDDIRHVKHARSVEQMKADPRFEILALTEEKFGSLLAHFNPVAPQRELTWEIIFGPGAYAAEGNLRWLAQRAELTVPAEQLRSPAELKLTIGNGDLWCYGGRQILTTVILGDRTMAQLRFGRDGETHNLSMVVEPTDAPLPLIISSSAAFVPAQIDAKSQDQRSLAVKLQDLSLIEIAPGNLVETSFV